MEAQGQGDAEGHAGDVQDDARQQVCDQGANAAGRGVLRGQHQRHHDRGVCVGPCGSCLEANAPALGPPMVVKVSRA